MEAFELSSTDRVYIRSKYDRLLLDENGRIKLYPAFFYYGLPSPLEFIIWTRLVGRYHIPTIESIEFIKHKIAGRKAIEIGSGSSDLSYHLGIQGTDSYLQTDDTMREYYRRLGQAVTEPREDIERVVGLDAVIKHKPDIVIATWVTELYEKGLSDINYSNVFGVNEKRLLSLTDYLFVGTVTSHRNKQILNSSKYSYDIFTWDEVGLVSRTLDHTNNICWHWRKQ